MDALSEGRWEQLHTEIMTQKRSSLPFSRRSSFVAAMEILEEIAERHGWRTWSFCNLLPELGSQVQCCTPVNAVALQKVDPLPHPTARGAKLGWDSWDRHCSFLPVRLRVATSKGGAEKLVLAQVSMLVTKLVSWAPWLTLNEIAKTANHRNNSGKKPFFHSFVDPHFLQRFLSFVTCYCKCNKRLETWCASDAQNSTSELAAESDIPWLLEACLNIIQFTLFDGFFSWITHDNTIIPWLRADKHQDSISKATVHL